MRSTRSGGIAILVALTMLLTVASAPVSAITLQRTWFARMGTSGTIAIKAYTNGVGSISFSLRGLRAHATYSVQIRTGTCSRLGTVTARPASVVSSASGTVARTNYMLPWIMTKIWSTARKPSFVVRIVSGSSVRCGAFTFTHATRVAVSGLGIDLPVIRGPSSYPPCRVAMYLATLAQPREPGITFIYAHARTGMFLPLLTKWKASGSAGLIGRTVRVWESDSTVSYYRIVSARKTTTPMVGASVLTRERLWLQTSTGPNFTYPKLIVEATRYKTVKTTYAAAHPRARPIRC